MAHTPGPWLIDRNLVYALNKRGTNSFTAYFEGESQSDNARLVHAAPDLLAALKDTSDALAQFVDAGAKIRKPYEHPLSAYDRAIAAIAKAEGVQK